MTTPAPPDPAALAALLGAEPRRLEPVRGGANSRVWRVDTDQGRFALKSYPPPTAADPRDRLAAESTALTFLARHGVTNVPRLHAVDRNRHWAAYHWLDGQPVGPIGPPEITAALGFLGQLHALRHAEGAAGLNPASEACLSLPELLAQLQRRRQRLLSVSDGPRVLLEGAFTPVLAAASAQAQVLGTAELAPTCRTLSPSDFGCHNALRRPEGTLAFLDFEYFGWDDPVKLVADVVLHPGMTLDTAARRSFAEGARLIYGEADGAFAERLAALLPLYALRWSLIVLNEFLPERWQQRQRAGESAERPAVLARQLAKAERLLETAATLLLDGGLP